MIAATDARRCTIAADGGGGNDNSDVASDPSGGAYVNHGATVLWQHKFSRSVGALVRATSAAFYRRLAQLMALRGADAAATAAAKLEEEEAMTAYEKARQARKAANEEGAAAAMMAAAGYEHGYEPPDVISRNIYGKRYGAPYRHLNGKRPEVQSHAHCVCISRDEARVRPRV